MKQLLDFAKLKPVKIVLSDGDDIRAIEAAIIARDQGAADITLVGSPEKMASLSTDDLSGITIHNPKNSDHSTALADLLFQLRAHKGMTLDEARGLVKLPHIYAALLVRAGLADGCIGGATVSTADIVRAALQIIGVDHDIGLVSSFFLMLLQEESGERPVIFTDCGLVVDPNAEQLAKIAIGASKALPMFTKEKPKVAMLSFSTHGSANHPFASKMREATELAKLSAPELCIDGELQFDAAFVPSVARSKAPESDVAGVANIFVFPNLDAGNIGYKIAQRIGGAVAIGPILQGLKNPANDLSRGCSSDDIYKMILVTATQINMK